MRMSSRRHLPPDHRHEKSMSESTSQPVTITPVSNRKRLQGFYDLSVEELSEKLKELGAPAFRAKQLYNWGYENYVSSWGDMKNIPTSLQEKLEESLPFA